MGVRYRLFLWLSGLFVVVAVFSYFMENYVTRRELAIAEKNFRTKILAISDQRRVEIQNFLASVIAENEVRIDAILNNISVFSPQVLQFGPTLRNAKNGTWGEVADLLLDNKWIDFLQNTNGELATATIVATGDALSSAYRISIDEDLSWVYLPKVPDPFFAVKIPYTSNMQGSSALEAAEQIPGIVPAAFLLFDVKAMGAPSEGSAPILESGGDKTWPPIPVKWTEGHTLEMEAFVKAFQRGRGLLLSQKIHPPQLPMSEVQEKIDGDQGGKLNLIPIETFLSSAAPEKMAQKRFEEIALRYTEVSMIWALIAIYDSGIFGPSLFAFPSPSAITVFSTDNAVGIGVSTADVVLPSAVFNDAAYYQNNAPQSTASTLGTSIAVITSSESNHVFLGNTVQLVVKTPTGDRTGYLTAGIDADGILQKLVQAIGQTAVLVHDQKPLTAYRANGEKIGSDGKDTLPLSTMLSEKSGIIFWEKENYYFAQFQPFPDVDLHFILLNPEAKEFALINDLEKGSQQVADSVLFNIHITGLVALILAIVIMHNISKKITRPIIQLAKATNAVAEGRLDQIKLDLPPLKHNDEIAVLCHSFEEMVNGLIEKEKVKGVLNKVVSQEIAQEILKGVVHLGGEEKMVTVLFADIRDFTKMTQNMAPSSVIELLNTCMTKITHCIDQNSGVIDKYVGDEAMALFGAPIANDDAAFKAIKSAVEMIQVLESWNTERVAARLPPIEMGIGIHSGKMLAGNMGAENRLNYTVIGSNVNLAARLCDAAKKMEILITKDTLDAPTVKERIDYEEISPMSFKGIDNPVVIFRVKGVKQ